jgi:hypothetical protein
MVPDRFKECRTGRRGKLHSAKGTLWSLGGTIITRRLIGKGRGLKGIGVDHVSHWYQDESGGV